MGFQADCPTCGAPIEFSLETSVVTICPNCGTASGRAGDALQNYGKVADLVDTRSPLKIDLVGETGGIAYQITGRTQLRHAAGGVWDEWYVAFRDGKQWGWLAEARGRYYLTFRKKLPENHSIPNLSELAVEDEVMIPKKGLMKVVEIGEATAISAEGEIPFKFHPGETYQYADLEGPGGKFATLDGTTSPPTLYVGGEFPLEKLGITADVADREQEASQAEALQLSCPQCGGSLDLVAPNEAERVGCPYCDSLLDVNQGNLKFLHSLNYKCKPKIPLGSKGTFDGVEYTIIGYMDRFVRVERKDYVWGEYLLYAPRKPYHWLMENQGHWTLGRPISAGEVRASYRTASHAGLSYRVFDRGTPKVKAVVGEFYWKVEQGEETRAVDYISPPFMLSREETIVHGSQDIVETEEVGVVDAVEVQPGMPAPTAIPPVAKKSGKGKGKQKAKAAKEVNYTIGRYMPVDTIEKAFGIKGLKRPTSIAPNQPYPYKGFLWLWLAMLAAAIVLGLFVFVTSPRKVVYQQSFSLVNTTEPNQIEFIEQPITIKGGDNLVIKVENNLANRWAYAEVDLVDDQGKKITATVPVYYDSTSGSKYLSALPGGNYKLRFAFKWQNMSTETQNVSVIMRQGVPRFGYWLTLAILLSILPIGVAIHQFLFEASRWSESGVV